MNAGHGQGVAEDPDLVPRPRPEFAPHPTDPLCPLLVFDREIERKTSSEQHLRWKASR